MLAAKGIIFLSLPAVYLALIGLRVGAADRVVDVTAGGDVVGDGETVNTAGIQKEIDDCSAAGGGTIRFPKGRYRIGTIQIKNNVTLRFECRCAAATSTVATTRW